MDTATPHLSGAEVETLSPEERKTLASHYVNALCAAQQCRCCGADMPLGEVGICAACRADYLLPAADRAAHAISDRLDQMPINLDADLQK